MFDSSIGKVDFFAAINSDCTLVSLRDFFGEIRRYCSVNLIVSFGRTEEEPTD